MNNCRFLESIRMISLIIAITMVASISGCFTVGHDFPVGQVSAIKIGKTTQADIRSMFGPPWRVGIEDGLRTWTYGKYRYSAFSEAKTQDLVVKFNDRDVVISFTFNSTEHEE